MNRARRRWMAWSVVPSALLVAGAVTVLGRAVEVERARSAWESAVDDPATASSVVERYRNLRWPGWFDPAVQPLGAGAAAVLAGDLNAARADFEEALREGDGEQRCRAAVNLVLTIEAQGDEIVELDAASARDLYQSARDEVDEHPACRGRRRDDLTGAGDRLDRAAERLDAKLITPPPGEAEQRPVSPEQTQSEPDESDLDDLDRALDENAETRSEGPEFEEQEVGVPPAPPDPQW